MSASRSWRIQNRILSIVIIHQGGSDEDVQKLYQGQAEHPVVRAAAKMNILPVLPERLLDLSKEQRGCSTGMTINRLRASKNLFV